MNTMLFLKKTTVKLNLTLIPNVKSIRHLYNKGNKGTIGYELPPLSIPLENANNNKPKYQSINSKIFDTHVTKLSNGLRVASEKLYGEFCTVGAIIDAGPRYEKPYMSGITHFLEKLAFNSTTNYGTRENIMQVLENYGAICDCQSGRDAIIYALSCRRKGLPEILDLLSDAIFRPTFKEHELEQVRRSIEFEIEDLNMKADPDTLLNEMIHKAAFQDNTFANPKICPIENVNKITNSMLYSFMKSHYKSSRMVLTCVGVDHDEFLEMSKEKFEKKTPIWIEQNNLYDSRYSDVIDNTVAKWNGGSFILKKDLSHLTQNQFPELVHLVIGLESPSFKQERHFVASCVLNMLMGGGGSFSAGGPGKGMYSRLYLNVLNKYYFMFNATALNQSYNDAGIFYIHSSSPLSNFNEMVKIICSEFLKMCGPYTKDELLRAKRQLQSMLFMNLEQRPVQFEDISRQVLSRSKREQASYYFDQIESITENDLVNVANKMLESKPAVAILGQIDSSYEPYEEISKMLKQRKNKFTKQLFSSL